MNNGESDLISCAFIPLRTSPTAGGGDPSHTEQKNRQETQTFPGRESKKPGSHHRHVPVYVLGG